MTRRSRLKKGAVIQKKQRLSLGEALERIKHAKIYADYSIPPLMKRFQKGVYKDIKKAVKFVAPKAKIALLPKKWMVRGKVKDPFQDFRVSNITAGEALRIAVQLTPQSVILKG